MSARQIHKRSACWVAVLLTFALMASACGGGDDGGESQPSQAVETTETAAPSEPVDSGDDDGDSAGATEEEPAPTDTEPETVQEQEPLVAPVDTTTTTTPPAPSEDGEVAPEAPAEPEPQFGGTLRVGIEAESDGLNPAANNFAVSAYIMTYPIFDPLTYYDKQGNGVPVLAESWTKIGDGTNWHMKLREGIRFHDGTELEADDVVATFTAQLADPVISLAFKPGFDPDEPFRKIDDYTVEYRGVRPSARLPIYFASQLGMILPSEWLERALADPSLNQMPVGTGPFMIESRVQDEKTVLVRNPDYWAADTTDIYLESIEIYPITDTAIAAERLAAGDLDLIVTANAEATLTLREAADRGVVTFENQRSEESFAVINTEKPPFDDIRARQALTFATDRDAYVELIRQGTTPAADSMFHPDLIWHNPNVKQETNMPERAGPVVASYCADNPGNCSGGKINMEYIYAGPSVENTRVTDLLINSWDEFFNVTSIEVLQDDLIVYVVLGNYNVVGWRQFGDVDPDNDVLWMECGTIGFIALNFPRYCSEERDELMYEQRRIDDLDRRVEIWHRIQEIVRDSYSYIFYHHTNWVIGARDNVHNVCGQISPVGDELFCNNQGRIWLNQLWLS